jgi:anthranilate/para-aminobenzoate synthase component I
VIILPAESLPASAAAGRVGRGQAPAWLCSPGGGELAVEREYLACDPVAVVRGESVPALAAAWAEARARWDTLAAAIPVAVGYLSYDLGRSRWAPSLPGLEFRFYDAFWVREAATGQAQICATDATAAARLQARLQSPLDDVREAEEIGYQLDPLVPVDPPEQHLAAIARVKEYLLAGDVYQVNLARRLRARCRSQGPTGLALFRQLQAEAPAPHALWLGDHRRDDDGHLQAPWALVGNSPERFLRVGTERSIETAPIKGTRPRATGAADEAIARELMENPKDRAEHVMIVDLERNDLGRICQTGSVVVADPLQLLPLPSVFHLVTTVRGQLLPGVGLVEMLAACFPGGSVTGAPKIRAMQIIDELEPAARGPYTGATGWLGAAGDLDLALAIRTAVLAGEELTLWVGGGIVVDSLAEAELEETVVKARAFSRLEAPTMRMCR